MQAGVGASFARFGQPSEGGDDWPSSGGGGLEAIFAGRFGGRSFVVDCGSARANPQTAIPTVEVAQSWHTHTHTQRRRVNCNPQSAIQQARLCPEGGDEKEGEKKREKRGKQRAKSGGGGQDRRKKREKNTHSGNGMHFRTGFQRCTETKPNTVMASNQTQRSLDGLTRNETGSLSSSVFLFLYFCLFLFISFPSWSGRGGGGSCSKPGEGGRAVVLVGRSVFDSGICCGLFCCRRCRPVFGGLSNCGCLPKRESALGG